MTSQTSVPPSHRPNHLTPEQPTPHHNHHTNAHLHLSRTERHNPLCDLVAQITGVVLVEETSDGAEGGTSECQDQLPDPIQTPPNDDFSSSCPSHPVTEKEKTSVEGDQETSKKEEQADKVKKDDDTLPAAHHTHQRNEADSMPLPSPYVPSQGKRPHLLTSPAASPDGSVDWDFSAGGAGSERDTSLRRSCGSYGGSFAPTEDFDRLFVPIDFAERLEQQQRQQEATDAKARALAMRMLAVGRIGGIGAAGIGMNHDGKGADGAAMQEQAPPPSLGPPPSKLLGLSPPNDGLPPSPPQTFFVPPSPAYTTFLFSSSASSTVVSFSPSAAHSSHWHPRPITAVGGSGSDGVQQVMVPPTTTTTTTSAAPSRATAAADAVARWRRGLDDDVEDDVVSSYSSCCVVDPFAAASDGKACSSTSGDVVRPFSVGGVDSRWRDDSRCRTMQLRRRLGFGGVGSEGIDGGGGYEAVTRYSSGTMPHDEANHDHDHHGRFHCRRPSPSEEEASQGEDHPHHAHHRHRHIQAAAGPQTAIPFFVSSTTSTYCGGAGGSCDGLLDGEDGHV